MDQIDEIYWNEHGDIINHMTCSTDAGIRDISRIMREHRDLRRSLSKALDLLECSGYVPQNERDELKLVCIREISKRNPI